MRAMAAEAEAARNARAKVILMMILLLMIILVIGNSIGIIKFVMERESKGELEDDDAPIDALMLL